MEEEDVRVAATENNTKTKVMVAIDDSEFSEHALTWALKTLGSTLVDSEFLIYTARSPVDISYLYASSWGSKSFTLLLYNSVLLKMEMLLRLFSFYYFSC